MINSETPLRLLKFLYVSESLLQPKKNRNILLIQQPLKNQNMNIKRIIIASLIMVSIWAVATQCKSTNNDDKHKGADTVITAKELPVIVPGFNFPEDSNKIYSWLKPYDSVKVYNHAWGVWAGLTAQSGETYEGDSLLIYQTWLGIGDIQNLIESGQTNLKASNLETKSGRVSLAIPNQLKHARERLLEAKKLKGTIDTSAGTNFGTNFWVAVAYDPNAVKHVVSKSLLKQSVLLSYLKKDSVSAIPPFPAKAITTKPVYYVGHKGDSLIRIPAWPGPPTTPGAFDPSIWYSYVYADVFNTQPAGKKLVPVTTSNPTQQQIQAATCNLSDFINFKISAAMAAYLNQQQSAVQGDTAKAGDIALLVAMHVTTKEISNWTWQTFYWAPNPGTPLSPSSNLAASLRPKELQGAAAHYALATAYVEITPNQPITGGTNAGASPMIGYNPYLEAGFDSTTFVGFKQSFNPNFKYGIQTNCMSCHAIAVMNATTTASSNTIYTTDQYIDMSNPYFKNQVQLDFAWSVESGIIYDDTTGAAKAKPKK